jgi:hypothetical protein
VSGIATQSDPPSSRRSSVTMLIYLHLTSQLALAGLRMACVLSIVALPAVSPLVSEVLELVVEVEVCEDCEACVANGRQERRFSGNSWGVAKHRIDSSCRTLAVKRHHSAVDGHRLHNGILAPLRC